ncbi:MAG: hypothetical protein R6X16_05335 [Anaerolineae bacterium]
MSLRWRRLVLAAVACVLCLSGVGRPAAAEPAAAGDLTYRIYLPMQFRSSPQGCLPIPEEVYYAIPVHGLYPDSAPAELHPDLNLALRSYRENLTAYRGLVDYNGDFDDQAPRLQSLFGDDRWPGIARVYQVNDWDGSWPWVYRDDFITVPSVTLAGMISTPGEKVRVPYRPAEIFHDTVTGRHYVAMVLYAAPDRITLKYTRDDHVIEGYTIHIEGICVEPRLVALYSETNAAGRSYLPGLQFGQAIGRAVGSELGVAIRDRGSFMDPRSRKDWWQGLSASSALDIPLLDARDEDWYREQQAWLAAQEALETER